LALQSNIEVVCSYSAGTAVPMAIKTAEKLERSSSIEKSRPKRLLPSNPIPVANSRSTA
jgi:hypothetical protein